MILKRYSQTAALFSFESLLEESIHDAWGTNCSTVLGWRPPIS
jgi:hypothetical protein